MSTLVQQSVYVNGKAVKVNSISEAAQVMNMVRIHDIDAQIEALKTQRANHVEALYELFGGTGKHVIPEVGEVTFSDNNVYDDKAIMDALKPGQQRLVTKRVLDRAKVRALYPAKYEAAKSYRGYKASVKSYSE